MEAVRGFARYLAGVDSRTQVPPIGLVPMRKRWRPPFIFSEADVAALIAECRRSIPSPFRALTYETLFGLLAVTGLRVGEALRLDRDDLDRREGLLVIRRSKFKKSRLVPLHDSVQKVLVGYAARRDAVHPKPESPAFFLSNRATRLIYPDVFQMFRQVRNAVGIGNDSSVRPRIHDLRHSFAVHCLVEWYRDGADVQSRLQWLSTYLGHHDPRSTYWYLSAAPELLAHAAQALERAPWAVAP